MDEKETISVIVPVWNAEDSLGRCIESITGQTYQNLEILLVDDGSTDRSLDICRQYAEKDPRIRVFHKSNGGQASARNYALDRCSGMYVGFVDDDDWCMPDMYRRLHEIITKYHAEVSRCDDQATGDNPEDGTKEIVEDVCKGKEYHKNLFCDIWGGHVTDRLFMRSVIGHNRFPQSKTIEDMRFMRLLLPEIHSEAHTNEKLYFYTMRQGQTSERLGRTYVSSFERAEEYQNRYREAIKSYPEYLDILLPKSVTFACGSMHMMIREGRKDSEEYEVMKSFLKEYKREILRNRSISIKYKFFVELV